MTPESHRYFAGKHLVVLGCGYIGGEVAREGLARGLQVTALTRNASKADRLRGEGMTVVEADLAGEDWHARMPAQVDFVLNSVSSGGGGAEGYRHSYLEGMRSIAKWSGQSQIGTFIYTGSTSVYPQGDGAHVDETCPIGADNDRIAALVETEALVRELAVTRWFILRLAGIYGPGRHHLLEQVRSGDALAGRDDHRLNLAHRDDIASAVWAAFSAPSQVANEVFNVADDTPVTKGELVRGLATRLGVPAPSFDASLPSMRGRSVPDRVILNAKIKRLLGWQPQFPDWRAGYEPILRAL